MKKFKYARQMALFAIGLYMIVGNILYYGVGITLAL
jgi:hypothetical protein